MSHVISVGAHFGVQIVVTPFGYHIEVATYRGETAYNDHRHPDSLEFLQDLSEDLARRDFTINAIAWDPISNTITDPHNGISDLQNKILDVVCDAQD